MGALGILGRIGIILKFYKSEQKIPYITPIYKKKFSEGLIFGSFVYDKVHILFRLRGKVRYFEES